MYNNYLQEADLCATQYLPDIARLQQCLYDKFNRQLDKKDSKQQTVGLFIEELPSGEYPIHMKFPSGEIQYYMC